MAKNDNVVKFHRTLNLNIGFVVFFVIIIYVIFHIFTYITSNTIAEYEVSQGKISTNNIYRGMIIRDESVYYAQETGDVDYYVGNTSKVCVGDLIYSVDTKGNVSEKISKENSSGETLDTDSIKNYISDINGFITTYDGNDFLKVYSFKQDLSSSLTQTMNRNALKNIEDSVGQAQSDNTFYTYNSEQTGIIYYGIDGYEDVNVDNFTVENFENTNLEETTLGLDSKVSQLDPVYKIVNSENWNIIINVSKEIAEDLSEKSYLKIRFCDDDFTTNVSYSLVKKEGKYFLNLNLTNSMIRYINQRFTNIELVLNSDTGLKIPNSSITEKEFYTIPKECIITGGDSKEDCLMIKDYNADGGVRIVVPTIFYETDDYCYIDDEEISDGDELVIPNSTRTYTVGKDKDKLTGVYNINKGYAVFKYIEIISQNNDYAIIDSKTKYGVALYDHIALDGSSVVENQTIN